MILYSQHAVFRYIIEILYVIGILLNLRNIASDWIQAWKSPTAREKVNNLE